MHAQVAADTLLLCIRMCRTVLGVAWLLLHALRTRLLRAAICRSS